MLHSVDLVKSDSSRRVKDETDSLRVKFTLCMPNQSQLEMRVNVGSSISESYGNAWTQPPINRSYSTI